MTAEVVIAAVVALSGFGTLMALAPGIDVPSRVWLSIPVGFSVFTFIVLCLLVLEDTVDPYLALVVVAGVGLGGIAVAAMRRLVRRRDLAGAGLAVVIAALVVVVARVLHMTRLTPDSIRYLLAASDLVRPDALAEINRADLLNRQLGVPALQTLFTLVGRRYVSSLSPLFGAFGLGLFAWLALRFSTGTRLVGRRWSVAAPLLFLLASNRLLYDAFYINSHIAVAVFMLIAVAGSWLAVTGAPADWAAPAGFALAATLLFRPEQPIMVAIVLTAVAASRTGWRVRLWMTVPPVVLTVIWYGVILWQHANSGNEIALTAPVFASLVAVLGAALVVLIGGIPKAGPVTSRLDWVMLSGLVLLLVMFSIGDPAVLIASVEATFRNLSYEGMWLLTWAVALPLLLIALFVHRIPDARLWTVPILGFGVLFWLLPLIREGAWRVGAGDSGNRLLAHIFPVVVMFLILASAERSVFQIDRIGHLPSPTLAVPSDGVPGTDQWQGLESPASVEEQPKVTT